MIRKIRDSAIFLILSFSLALAGSEALLRVLDQAEPGQAANIVKPEDIDLTFNADGFRDRDYPETKPPGVFRILVLGNSVTFGVAVTSQQIYVKQLEGLFNAQKSGKTFEVMNLAGPGWNILYQEKFLESRGVAYEPDLVLIGYTLNSAEGYYIPPADLFLTISKYKGDPEVLQRNPRDYLQSLINPGNRDRQPDGLRQVWQGVNLWFSNHSDLYRYVRWRYDLRKQAFDDRNYPHTLYYEASHEHWDPCREALQSIGQTMARRRIPVALVVFPFFVKLKAGPNPDENYAWEDIHDLVDAAGREAGMTVIDMLPVFRGWDPRDISVDPYHMNPLGHRMAAETIHAELVKARLIPSN